MQTLLLWITGLASLTNLIIFFTERHDKKKNKPITTMSNELKAQNAELKSQIETLAEESRKADAELAKDLCRLQMLNLMDHRPEDVNELMIIAERYFIELQGNWYMDGRFLSHCEKYNIPLPSWFKK